MSDFAVKLAEARAKLPLKRLMEQHGKGAPNGKWKSFPECPYCRHKDCAGVFTAKDRGADLFKCHHTDCPTGGKAFDEAGFLQHELGLHDRREACIALMKEAGVWVEEARIPSSTLPGAPRRRNPLPSGPAEDAGLMAEAEKWARGQEEISVRGVMKALKLGYARAVSVLNELEKLEVISKIGENGARTVLPALTNGLEPSSTGPVSPAADSSSAAVAPAVPGDDNAPTPPEAGLATASVSQSGGGSLPNTETLKAETLKVATPLRPPPPFDGGDGEDNGGGGGDGGGAPPPHGEEEPAVPPALEALRWFYAKLTLDDKDRRELWEKRGLTDLTIDALGYRSNPQSNKEILLQMEQHFPMAVLLDCGLWKVDESKAGDPPKPNAQYYGMSIVERRDASGRKVRDGDGEPMRDCVWNNPVLIPCFNAKGELVHLRPHKGMMKDRAPHFYVARPAKEFLETCKAASGMKLMALVSEGEFKSAAQWQVLGDMASCASLPGITMAKPLFADIEEWLERLGVRAVVVGYDNEEKGDPKLPGYQEDEWKRHDAQAWARYLARQLSKQGYDGKVAVLPDEWRDPKTGKADWDGRLAELVKAESGKRKAETEKPSPHPDPLPSSEERRGRELVWEKVKGKARAEFLGVIKKALPVGELWQAGFFDRKEERIIKNKLEKISYEPRLPIGGDDEAALARRLQRLGMRLKRSDWFPPALTGFLFSLSAAYQSVNGRYYKMKPLTDKQKASWEKARELARSRADDDAKRAVDMVLRGKKSLGRPGNIPEGVSDFYLKPQYVLHRINGSRTRMVTLHNVHGVNTGLLTLPSREYTSPVEFRKWLADSATGGSWDGGQNELTALHEDLGHELAFKDVMEVPLRGCHDKSRMWFFEDICFSDEGEFKPDPKTGIFWVKSTTRNPHSKEGRELVQGYSFARDSSGRARDREDEVFRQGVPKMHPERSTTESDDREFFKEITTKLMETMGSYEAYMALGMVLGAAAGPEIFREWSAFPGLWVHGAQGEGKSSVCRWLIALWGFLKEKGLPLPADERGTLTAAALAGALGQYGEIHLWLDEYQPTAPSWVRAILKNSYDRAEGGKKDFGASPREFLSGVIVSGIATSTEPQTKSRFAHIQVSAKNRKANHYHWFQTNRQQFYRVGRHLMRHRKQYVETALTALGSWITSEAMRDVDDRARMVHGLAYAGFVASAQVFDLGFDNTGYTVWLREHCRASAAEVQESVSVDLFWRELLNALESDAFGEMPADRRRIFNAQVDEASVSPVSEMQTKWGVERPFTAWKSYLLYFQAGPVIEMLRKEKRKTGRDLPIQQSDLRNQMKVMPYWVEPDGKGKQHKQKFNGVNKSCWCIRVDAHDLGLVRVGDDEFEASMKRDGQQDIFFTGEEWMDPRKGDLFGLIESLESRHEEKS